MPKRLKTHAAYEKYVSALQAALVQPYVIKPCLTKGQALRFRQMCYQVRSMYRERNQGYSPWDDVVITFDPTDNRRVMLMVDTMKDDLLDPEGRQIDISGLAMPIEEKYEGDEVEPVLHQSDLDMLEELARNRGEKFKPNIAGIRVVKGMDVVRELPAEMPAIKPGDDPFGE